MKIIKIILLFILTSILLNKVDILEESKKQEVLIIDEDFLKHELQKSVIDFCNDAKIDTNDAYIPFME